MAVGDNLLKPNSSSLRVYYAFADTSRPENVKPKPNAILRPTVQGI